MTKDNPSFYQPVTARSRLLGWYKRAARDLPWRRTKDRWSILLSEIMLQQTRVSTVIPYYHRFLKRFPTPEAMARADESEVLALWSGLGYYSRARNLQRTAQAIAARGAFPASLEEIRLLPGVGDYTAAAVASIAFNLPYVVVDGNVLRVMSRLTAERGDIRATATRERLRELAQALLSRRHPGDFNQALMELGATLCSPRQPQCLLCPWRDRCQARALGLENELPVKRPGREPVRIDLRLLLMEEKGRVVLRLRPPGSARLAGYWELPERDDLPGARPGEVLGSFRHTITHHIYEVEVSRAKLTRIKAPYVWVDFRDLAALPISTMTQKAFRLARIPV